MICIQAKGHLSPMIRNLSKITTTLIVSMLLIVIAWGQTVDQGIYTITNNVMHDNPVGQGMARSYTEEQSDIEVNDSGIFLSLSFNNTQYMGELSISVDGSEVQYETISKENNIKTLKFKINSVNSEIKVGLYVFPMDTNVEYTVTLNPNSLKLIQKTEIDKENSSVKTLSPENNVAAKNDSNIQKNQDVAEQSTAKKETKVETAEKLESKEEIAPTDGVVEVSNDQVEVKEQSELIEQDTAKEVKSEQVDDQNLMEIKDEEQIKRKEQPQLDKKNDATVTTEATTHDATSKSGALEEKQEKQETEQEILKNEIPEEQQKSNSNIPLIVGITLVVVVLGMGVYFKKVRSK